MRKSVLLIALVILIAGIAYAQLSPNPAVPTNPPATPFQASQPPQTGYRGTGNSDYGGVTICGLNYDCGAADDIDPEQYGAACKVCDPDTPGNDAKCNGKQKGDAECDSKCQKIDKDPPTIETNDIPKWINKDFVLQVKESDESGIDCNALTYSTNARKYDNVETTTKVNVKRDCPPSQKASQGASK